MEKEKTTLQKLNKTTETEKKAAEKNYEKKNMKENKCFCGNKNVEVRS